MLPTSFSPFLTVQNCQLGRRHIFKLVVHEPCPFFWGLHVYSIRSHYFYSRIYRTFAAQHQLIVLAVAATYRAKKLCGERELAKEPFAGKVCPSVRPIVALSP